MATPDKTATQIADRLLAEDWSASAYVRELQNEQAAAQNILFILQDQELRNLEPLIKVRLLLAPLFLRKQERETLKDSLQVLADKLCLDDDEWVRVTAYAVGRYDGHLDLAAVAKASRAVEASMFKLQQRLASASLTSYRPLEEVYLSNVNADKARQDTAAQDTHRHEHFTIRAGAEATARHLTLPQAPVRRSPSPGTMSVPPTAAAGVAPKDATERRSIQSGASFVTGRSTLRGGSSGRAGANAAAGANLFMSARPPSRPSTASSKGGARKAPAGKTAMVLDSCEGLTLRAKAAYQANMRQEERRGVKRPVNETPNAAAEVIDEGPADPVADPAADPAASAVIRDPAAQPIWSPDTPEYIPQFTCQYHGKDVEGEIIQDSSIKQRGQASAAPQAIGSEPKPVNAAGVDSTLKQGYGSASMAPFAFRRTGR